MLLHRLELGIQRPPPAKWAVPFPGAKRIVFYARHYSVCVQQTGNVHSLQARSEYAHDFDGLSRIGTRFLLDTTFRFGFESEVNQWRESLGAGNYDELWTGDANVFFRFAQSSRLQMRTGIGANWLSDEEGSEHGFNFTYQADFMPSKPWVISTELDLGKLGESSLIHGRITTGLQWRRTECYVGYDYYQVGDVPLKGFVGGIRLWF